MDNLFPFGFQWQTALYLVLYIATLAMHLVLMNYVVAGTFVLLLRSFGMLGKGAAKKSNTIGTLLQDWMPFSLGGAITAGVAPLLFIQILYQERFYTANLLLFHRWMVILPVLIAGFYLLYVLKSQWLQRRQGFVRVIVTLAAICCFLFVGYSWTENHLLSNRDQQTWSLFYKLGTVFYYDQSLVSRMLVWFFGAFPTLWMIVGWQLRRFQFSERPPTDLPLEIKRASRNALVSLVLSLVAAVSYAASLSTEVQSALFSPMTVSYLIVAVLGFVLQVIGWRRVFVTGSLQHFHLVWVTVGQVLTMFSMLVHREAIRLSHFDIETLHASHAESAKVGGMTVFLIFLVINTVIIAWCLRQISRESQDSKSEIAP